MTKAYWNDLRERVVAAVVAGDSCRTVAARFGVSVSSVVKWSQRWRTTGSVAPDKMGGYRPVLLEPHRDFIVEQVRQSSHVTARGLQRALAQRGVKVSHDSVWRFLRREGLSFKKSLFAIEQARVDIARRRRRWKGLMADLDPSRLVFVDKTWIKTNACTRARPGCGAAQRLGAQGQTAEGLRTERPLAHADPGSGPGRALNYRPAP